MKAAVLSERGQAEEELIKARNQARLEEVSFGHKYGGANCSTLQRSLAEVGKTRAVGLRTGAQRSQWPAGLWCFLYCMGKRKARNDRVGLRCRRRAQQEMLLDSGQV